MQKRIFQFNGTTFNITLRDEADESVANEIFKFREYKAVEEPIAEAKGCIIDVGAHRGFFTLYARALNATVPVIALEPEPGNTAAFREHMEENNIQNVTLVPSALFAITGKSGFIVTPDSHNHVLDQVDTPLGERIVVPTITLENLLALNSVDSVDLLKMDIEGAEYPILESLDPATWAKIRRVVLEYHTLHGHKPHELENILRENGFGVQKFPSKFDTTMGFIVARNKRVPAK